MRETYTRSLAAIIADERVGTGSYVLNWSGSYYLHEMHAQALAKAFGQTGKPLAAVSNFLRSDDAVLAERFSSCYGELDSKRHWIWAMAEF